MLSVGLKLIFLPNWPIVASSLNVPRGPKNETQIFFSRARQLEITALKISITPSLDNGPLFNSDNDDNICASL